MKYTGLCEKYGALTVYAAAVAIPFGLDGASLLLTGHGGDVGAIVNAGVLGYMITHFTGKPLTAAFLAGKEKDMGPTRASAVARKIQTAAYAVTAGSLFLAFQTVANRTHDKPADLHNTDKAPVVTKVPAPAKFHR